MKSNTNKHFEDVEVNSDRWFDLTPLLNEEWRSLKEYNNYEISNYSRIKTLPGKYKKSEERILKVQKNKYGYSKITISKNKKSICTNVHRLMGETFLDSKTFKYYNEEDKLKYINNMAKLQINHIDENKMNNKINNLEYCTAKYNMNYGNSKYSRNEKLKIINKGKHYSIKTEYKKGDNAKKIICIEKNKIYDSIIEASVELKINAGNITNVCKHKKHNKTAGGYHFEYI